MKTNKSRSIKRKLITVPLFVVLTGVVGMAFVSSYFTRTSSMQEMQTNGIHISEQIIERLEDNATSLMVINNMLDDKITTAAKIVSLNDENLNSLFFRKMIQELDVDEVNYFAKNGEIMYSSVQEYVGMVGPEGHAIYDFLKSNQQELMEDIRQDSESDRYFKYGYLKDNKGGAIQIGISADTVHGLTETFNYQFLLDEISTDEKIVYATLINPSLEIIASSNNALIGIIHDGIGSRSAAIDGEPYTEEIYYDPADITVFDVSYPVVINGENIGAISIGYKMDSTKSAIKKNTWAIVIAGWLAFAILGIILYRASNYAIKIVHQLKKQMDFMASGDFTKDIPKDLLGKKDEFGEISKAVSTMQNAIKDVLRNVIEASEQLAASSEELTATSEQSALAADEVAKVIEDIAHGASDQAKETEQGVLAISVLGDLVVENTKNIEGLNRTTGKVIELKDEGLHILEELVEKTTINRESSKEVQRIIIDTNESAGQIARASEMIQSIADQTNLLALNAAIEAARAGDAGRGFAVVADEIRQLAEQSAQFTGEISTIITDLTGKTTRAVATMDELEKIVSSQSESVRLTNHKFDGIAEAIEEAKRVTGIISGSSDEMAKRKEDIVSIMEHLSAISQENAAGTQQAAASVEEQTASTQEIAHSSEDLAKIAEELNDRINQFHIQ